MFSVLVLEKCHWIKFFRRIDANGTHFMANVFRANVVGAKVMRTNVTAPVKLHHFDELENLKCQFRSSRKKTLLVSRL
jgi:hypothetical protein